MTSLTRRTLCVLLSAVLTVVLSSCAKRTAPSDKELSQPETSSRAAAEPSSSSQDAGSAPDTSEPVGDLSLEETKDPLTAELESLAETLLCSGLAYHPWESWQQADMGDLQTFIFLRMIQEGLVPTVSMDTPVTESVPADVFEASAERYFGISAEPLRKGTNWYDESSGTYTCNFLWTIKELNYEVRDLTLDHDGDIQVLRFDCYQDGKRISSHTLRMQGLESGLRFLSCGYVSHDLEALCAAMNICAVDVPFQDPNEWTAQQQSDFAFWVIDRERIQAEKWYTDWEGEDGKSKVPLDVVEDALSRHLNPVDFHPEQLEDYDPQSKVFHRMIGGYGGVRNPKLVSDSLDGDIYTLVIEYWDQEEKQLLSTYTYRIQTANDDQDWSLLSVQKHDAGSANE